MNGNVWHRADMVACFVSAPAYGCRVTVHHLAWMCMTLAHTRRCSICPFMIYGEVMQRWRVAQGVVLHKWPREESECCVPVLGQHEG